MLRDTARSPGFKAGAHLNYSTLGPGLLCLLGFPIPFLGSPKSSSNSPQDNPELAPGATKDGVQGGRGCMPPELAIRSGLSFQEGR